MLQCLSLRRRRLTSYQCSTASCPLTPPLPFASCLPAGCCVAASASQLSLADLLFASWLSRCPCCRAAAASCPLVTPPTPHDSGISASQRSTSTSHRATSSCPLTPLLPFPFRSPAGCHVTSHHAAASRSCVHPRPPPSCALAGCPVASHCAAHVAPTTHLPFAPHSPQLVACAFDLVCLISWFLAVCACIFQQLEGHKCRFRQLCYSV